MIFVDIWLDLDSRIRLEAPCPLLRPVIYEKREDAMFVDYNADISIRFQQSVS